jgi:uncharacterized alpha-E superfamily protein
MLSRIAENVYWVGRYVERSDDTVRLVATHYYGLLQIGSPGDGLFPEELLAVLGTRPAAGTAPSLNGAVARAVTDPDNLSSVASCLRAARENARRSREVLPLELWETLSAATAWLDDAAERDAPADELLRQAPNWTRAFFGLVDIGMPRTQAWRTMRLGMLLERADMTLRVLILAADTLRAGAEGDEEGDDPLTVHLWSTALRSCAAMDAFWAGTPGFPTAGSVGAVLLRDELCPRSVTFCMRQAAALLAGHDEPLRLIDRLLDELGTRPADELLRHGSAELRGLLGICQELNRAIGAGDLDLAEVS